LPRVAELRGGKQLELDLAVGALLDQRGYPFQSAMARLQRRLEMTDLGGVFRRGLRPRAGAACRQSCTGKRQEITSRCHGRTPSHENDPV
jgi:hypothetical protein